MPKPNQINNLVGRASLLRKLKIYINQQLTLEFLLPLHHQQAPKPAWLKGLAVIDLSLYRRFYRQKRISFADAGDGAICVEATLSTSWSITFNVTPSSHFKKVSGKVPTSHRLWT